MLASLHAYLQWVLGWHDSHAHEFRVGPLIIAPDWWIQERSLDEDLANYRDERRFSVAAVVREIGARGEFEYHYDMGDGWRHRIVIETTSPSWERHELPLPTCVAGENACPPEDVGGPHGYMNFLESLLSQTHDEHEQSLQWIGGAFDAKGFDLNRINRDWRGSKRRRD
jgi:hypothetical protein